MNVNEEFIAHIATAMTIVHESYKEAYLENGLTTESAQKLMEKIFQDTFNKVKAQYIISKILGEVRNNG